MIYNAETPFEQTSQAKSGRDRELSNRLLAAKSFNLLVPSTTIAAIISTRDLVTLDKAGASFILTQH
jgi:hypothetical protein